MDLSSYLSYGGNSEDLILKSREAFWSPLKSPSFEVRDLYLAAEVRWSLMKFHEISWSLSKVLKPLKVFKFAVSPLIYPESSLPRPFIWPSLSLPKPTLFQPRVGSSLPRPTGSAAYVWYDSRLNLNKQKKKLTSGTQLFFSFLSYILKISIISR
jgi:hypothetical protein